MKLLLFVFMIACSAQESCQKMYVKASNLNEREGPDTSFKSVRLIPRGEAVCVVSTTKGWSLLNNGHYVSSKHLTSSNPNGGSSNNTPTNSPTTTPTTISNTLGEKGKKVRDALLSSQWKSKADMLGSTYELVINNGYSTKTAIGLMANLVAEGNYGVVEYSFSTSHCYNFRLPSGSTNGKAKTIEDIKYVRDWPIRTEKTRCNGLNKGSCGFGSVQWSFDRRVNFANTCLQIMKTDADVNDNNWRLAEANFIMKEFKKGGYYNTIANAAKSAGGSVEDWAEAFTDTYELPKGSDKNMSGTGKECIKRRENARSLYDYLKQQNAI